MRSKFVIQIDFALKYMHEELENKKNQMQIYENQTKQNEVKIASLEAKNKI